MSINETEKKLLANAPAKNIIEDIGYKNAVALDGMLTKHAVPFDWKISIINGMWQRSSTGFTHHELRDELHQYKTKAFEAFMAQHDMPVRKHRNGSYMYTTRVIFDEWEKDPQKGLLKLDKFKNTFYRLQEKGSI